MSCRRSVCVFCGSSGAVEERHRQAARALGRAIAERGDRLVYGGGKVGLMGLLADAAVGAGGEVVGVIPRFLVDLEVAHQGLAELRVVESMHDRKRVMAELSDAFVVLPGGFGTLEEAIEIVSWRQLALHDKPVVFVNVGRFWEPLERLVDRFVGEGFANREHRRLFAVVDTVEEACTRIASTASPATAADLKWT